MLRNKIQSDATDALKQGSREIASVLRLVLASIANREKEKRYKISKQEPNLEEEDLLIKKSELSDEEVISVLSSEIKKRKDAIELYQKGNRQELADKEKKEVEIIQKYLPEQLSGDELRQLIQESVNKVGGPAEFLQVKDMGKIMADLMPKVRGRADNSEISRIIKEILAK